MRDTLGGLIVLTVFIMLALSLVKPAQEGFQIISNGVHWLAVNRDAPLATLWGGK